MTPDITPRRTRHLRLGIGALVLVCLAGVFYLYSRPDFLVLVANQVWACF